MKKKSLLIGGAVIALALTVVVAAFGMWSKDDDRYRTHTFRDEQHLYVDDTAVRGDGNLSGTQKAVETFVLENEFERVFEAYEGYDAFPVGMNSEQVGLAEEMEARLSMLYAKHRANPLYGWEFYVTFEDIDVRGNAAKVVCHYRLEDAEEPGKVMEEESEVLFLTKEAKDWTYVNLISTEGGTDPAFFEKACASRDPKDWLTTYSYNECKRRDYADGFDYMDYVNGAEGVDPALAGLVAAASGKTEPEPTYDLAAVGQSISEHRNDDGSFTLFGTTYSHARFTPENLIMRTEMGGAEEQVAKANKNSNMAQIKDVVEGLNRTYLSSRFSGVYRLYPREHFANDGIYKEANARTLSDMFENPNLGVNVYDGTPTLWINEIRVNGDWAKVSVTRSLNVGYSVMVKPIYDEEYQEGYLLKKVGGKWVIENILFTSCGYSDTFQQFKESSGKAEDWQKHYRFKACRRADYQDAANYSDFIQGDIESPVFVQ